MKIELLNEVPHPDLKEQCKVYTFAVGEEGKLLKFTVGNGVTIAALLDFISRYHHED